MRTARRHPGRRAPARQRAGGEAPRRTRARRRSAPGALIAWAERAVLDKPRRRSEPWPRYRQAQIACPRCATALVAVPGPEITRHTCSACGGVWIDEEDLRR